MSSKFMHRISEKLVTKTREKLRILLDPRLIRFTVTLPFLPRSDWNIHEICVTLSSLTRKGLTEKCTVSARAAVTDPRSSISIRGRSRQIHCFGPNRMLKTQHGGTYFSLVGSDRVDIAWAFCTLLAHERILYPISADFHAARESRRPTGEKLCFST